MANGKALNPYERNFKLQNSIMDRVASGANDIHWLNDWYQKILDDPKPHVRLGLQLDVYRDEVTFWEQAFPTFGVRIVEILGPFLTLPANGLALQPPRPELESLVLFGRWSSLIKFVRIEYCWRALGGPAVYEYTVSEATQTELCVCICGAEIDWHRQEKPILEQITEKLQVRLWHSLKPALDQSLSYEARKALGQELLTQIALAILACVRGYKDFNILPLLATWRIGRYPWATRHQELCILCEGFATAAEL